jgi:hypothetical protein
MGRNTAAPWIWTMLLMWSGTQLAWAQPMDVEIVPVEEPEPGPIASTPPDPVPEEPAPTEPPSTEPPAPVLSHSEEKRVEHWRQFREKHPELYERKLQNNRPVRELMTKAGEVPTPGTEPAPPTTTTRTRQQRRPQVAPVRRERSDLGSVFASVSRGKQRGGGGRDLFSAFGGGRAKGGGGGKHASFGGGRAKGGGSTFAGFGGGRAKGGGGGKGRGKK